MNMFAKKMNLDMEDFLTTGHFLNVEERLVLCASLPTLQQENRFASVSFHGKIVGTGGDYYIAYGRGRDFIRNKRFFYSLDGQFWKMLFPPSAEDLSDFRLTRNRFTGDPTHIHRFQLADKKVVIREEVRLSAAVHLMDWETAIVPAGALQIDPGTGLVQENVHFEGLDDPTNKASYLHQRLPKSRDPFFATRRLCPAAGDAALKFLEPISNDFPSGCWVLRHDDVSGVVRLHNLWWPGHAFYYRTSERGKHGAMYMGLGDRNDDLPFML